MSYYTTQLRFICEKLAGLEQSNPDYRDINQIITKASTALFGNYPIFDENYRTVLNHKIIQHFYQQEIGFETEGQFIFRLNVKMNEIMPYYNKLYLLDLEDIELFNNEDYTETYSGKDEGSNTQNYGKTDTETRDFSDKNSGTKTNKFVADNSSSGSNTSTDTTKNITQDTTTTDYSHDDRFSDTPEGNISGVGDKTYLTDYRVVKDQTKNGGNITSTNSGSIETRGSNSENKDETSTLTDQTQISRTGTGNHKLSGKDVLDIIMNQNYTKKITGRNGINPIDQILKIRNSFLNIDMLIINELEVLFMQIF